MTSNICSIIPQPFFEACIRPPYEEATLQLARAFFHRATINETMNAAPSLVDRTFCVMKGILLMVPAVNWVIYAALRVFSMTVEGQFIQAVTVGDMERVQSYIDGGFDLNGIQESILFHSHPDVWPILLQAGVDPLQEKNSQSFIEYLYNTKGETYLQKWVNEGLISEAVILTPSIFLNAKQAGNSNLLLFLIQNGYLGSDEDFRGIDLNVESRNGLDQAVLTRDGDRLITYVKTHDFTTFCTEYTALKTHYPRLYTDWMWNHLFAIPDEHFNTFQDSAQVSAVTAPPPGEMRLITLTQLFDRINFFDPTAAHYKSPNELVETLDGTVYHRSIDYVREGLVNIREKITGSKEDETGATREEMQDHRCYLDWVIYYLQQNNDPEGPLDTVKANVLIDLGKAGQVCSGRYKDLFYECRCRLSGEEVSELNIEQQIMKHLGDVRALILYQIVQDHAHHCTHARDNLLYHLKQIRGIPGDPPHSVFDRQGIFFREAAGAKAVFDRYYSPSRQITYLADIAQAPGQQGRDFNGLLYQYIEDTYAPSFQHEVLEQIAAAIGEDEELKTPQEAQAFFKRFDSDFYVNPAEGNQSLKDYFTRYRSELFSHTVRPLSEDLMGYALPEGIHPLVIGKLLVELGHLTWRNKEFNF